MKDAGRLRCRDRGKASRIFAFFGECGRSLTAEPGPLCAVRAHKSLDRYAKAGAQGAACRASNLTTPFKKTSSTTFPQQQPQCRTSFAPFPPPRAPFAPRAAFPTPPPGAPDRGLRPARPVGRARPILFSGKKKGETFPPFPPLAPTNFRRCVPPRAVRAHFRAARSPACTTPRPHARGLARAPRRSPKPRRGKFPPRRRQKVSPLCQQNLTRPNFSRPLCPSAATANKPKPPSPASRTARARPSRRSRSP